MWLWWVTQRLVSITGAGRIDVKPNVDVTPAPTITAVVPEPLVAASVAANPGAAAAIATHSTPVAVAVVGSTVNVSIQPDPEAVNGQ